MEANTDIGNWCKFAQLSAANYTTSLAFGVDSATGNIIGMAHNGTLNRDEAVMWSAVPEPSSLVTVGILAIGLLRRKRLA